MARSDSGSPSPYPSPKRQRLSSPTYDEQFCLSQDEIHAFDTFEERFTQSSPIPPKPSQSFSSAEKRKRTLSIASALEKDKDEAESKEAGLDPLETFSSSPCQSPLPEDTTSQQYEAVFSGFQSAANVSQVKVDEIASQSGSASRKSDGSQSSNDGAGNATVNGGATSSATPARQGASGFCSALQIVNHPDDRPVDNTPSSSPDAPPEQDYANWFSSTSTPGAVVGFQSAKALRDQGNPVESSPPAVGFQSAKTLRVEDDQVLTPQPAESPSIDLPGFTSGRDVFHDATIAENVAVPVIPGSSLPAFTSGLDLVRSSQGAAEKTKARDWTMPSAEALARAAQKMKRWQQELDEDSVDVSGLEQENEPPHNGSIVPAQTPSRPVLRAVDNAPSPAQPPDSPTPLKTGFSKAGMLSTGSTLGGKNKAFKSPLMGPPTVKLGLGGPSHLGSPLNPNRANTVTSTSRFPARSSSPVRPTTSASSTASFQSPGKALGLTPRRIGVGPARGRPRFNTPFKPGMRPGDPARTQLEQKQAGQTRSEKVVAEANLSEGTTIIKVQPTVRGKGKGREKFFDLTQRSDRQSLADSGLAPQSYDSETLLSMGINVEELSQITPDLALYYNFHSPSALPPAVSQADVVILGPDAALKELHEKGCSLATKKWVDNHWGLILWKLAGMVCLQPEHESQAETRRWCWSEVMKQLLYRYERELNGVSRPPLRLITTHDAPASCPMVLCVSKITWHPTGTDEDGVPLPPSPELEVTDGWYRLRVNVDDVLERAMRKGHIRVGRKIAVANARLVSENKEPEEILEAYDLMRLQICGNSSHLAPWHAKLGFLKNPPVATLDSLNPDGGLVSLMDLTVVKVYSLAFVEFIERDGERLREGPFSERDEAIADETWKRQREDAASKLREDFEEKMLLCEEWAEKFEGRAGAGWEPFDIDDMAPANTEDRLMNLLENPDTFIGEWISITPDAAGWLARCIRDYIVKTRENMHEEIRREMEVNFPPRQVRSFRVVVVRDSRWSKREPLRKAQLTIWDVLGIRTKEGGRAGHFEPGQRFLVTNIYPTQQGAWMAPDIGSEVYLMTRRDSRITMLKA